MKKLFGKSRILWLKLMVCPLFYTDKKSIMVNTLNAMGVTADRRIED